MHMLIALCTNCKVHNTRILMTTEPVRDTNDIHPVGPPNSSITRETDSQTQYGKQEPPRSCDRDKIRCYRCAKIPNPIKSNDHPTRTSYVTTSKPLNFQLFDDLFKAVDCLYAETPAPVKKQKQTVPDDPPLKWWKKIRNEENREAASIFSFPGVGYVLFFNFHVFKHLVDFSSRNYSIAVVTKDLSHLTQHYDYFVGECEKLSASLQDVDPPIEQIPPEHRKVPIGPQNLCDEFTQLVHRTFVKMLHLPQRSIREKLMTGKLSENNQKLLELDTFTTTILVGDEEYADEVRKLTLDRLKCLVRNFIKEDLELFIRHIVGGGQVVIQANITHAEQMVMAIAQLLPYGCVKVKMCANTYNPEYKTLFNIVSILFSTKIPDDPEIMMIRVNEYSKGPMIPFSHSRVYMVKRPELAEYREPMSVVAERYLDLLWDDYVTVGVLENALDTTKEEWLQKAKIFHFMKNNTPLNNMEVLAKIRGCGQKDLKVIKFWTNGLSEVFKQGLGKDQGIDQVEYAFEQLCIQNYESKTKLRIKIKKEPVPERVPTPPPALVPPGDIETQPSSKIVFNAPYDQEHTHNMKVINSSSNRIGYQVKATEHLEVEPTCGVLDPKEAVLVAVSCKAFDFKQKDSNNDSVTIEWTNTPDDATKEFNGNWFQEDGILRRKKILIKYNL